MKRSIRIELPKPSNDELSKAIRQRRLWKNRIETCRRKLIELRRKIELLEFQEELNQLSPIHIPSHRVAVGSGLDWGVYWRDVQTGVLPLHRIKGFGVRRTRLVVESFRTIGELEGWRIVRGFSEIPCLTKATALKLEETLIKWLRRYAPEYRIMASGDSLPSLKKGATSRAKGGVLWLGDS